MGTRFRIHHKGTKEEEKGEEGKQSFGDTCVPK